MTANTWQEVEQEGFEGTSPVRSFPENGYGLYDMTGKVWERTSDFYTPGTLPDDAGRHDDAGCLRGRRASSGTCYDARVHA
jgi:formylglycine-generating enzyme required for sulfatase activity